jgi:hypothetical protein
MDRPLNGRFSAPFLLLEPAPIVIACVIRAFRFAFQCFILVESHPNLQPYSFTYLVPLRVPSRQVRRLKLPILTAQTTIIYTSTLTTPPGLVPR